mmetsp:Transcript_52452/g.121977  ORF Transcript_52452/g.121977 Transcript_52452/m.121977 type:complete len:234 (-) Transcript_52452:574-1275(-)
MDVATIAVMGIVRKPRAVVGASRKALANLKAVLYDALLVLDSSAPVEHHCFVTHPTLGIPSVNTAVLQPLQRDDLEVKGRSTHHGRDEVTRHRCILQAPEVDLHPVGVAIIRIPTSGQTAHAGASKLLGAAVGCSKPGLAHQALPGNCRIGVFHTAGRLFHHGCLCGLSGLLCMLSGWLCLPGLRKTCPVPPPGSLGPASGLLPPGRSSAGRNIRLPLYRAPTILCKVSMRRS